MREKIYNDGLTGSQRYKKKNVQLNIVLTPVLASKTRKIAAQRGISVNKFISFCIENYLNSECINIETDDDM